MEYKPDRIAVIMAIIYEINEEEFCVDELLYSGVIFVLFVAILTITLQSQLELSTTIILATVITIALIMLTKLILSFSLMLISKYYLFCRSAKNVSIMRDLDNFRTIKKAVVMFFPIWKKTKKENIEDEEMQIEFENLIQRIKNEG